MHRQGNLDKFNPVNGKISLKGVNPTKLFSL